MSAQHGHPMATASAPVEQKSSPVQLVVVSAGLSAASSTRRLGQLVADTACAQLADRGKSCRVTHVELRHTAEAVARSLVSGSIDPSVAAEIDLLRAADGLVVATPTINASFSGILKSFFDLLPTKLLRGLPTVIAATGGTHRHTLVLDSSVRPMLGYLRAVVLPSSLFVTGDEWDGERPRPELSARIEVAGEELAHYAWAARVGAFSI